MKYKADWMRSLGYALAFATTFYAGVCFAESSVVLTDLDPNEGVMESGSKLMALPLGLHRLELDTDSSSHILVGVHGFGSRGYEWVYPLQTIDDEESIAMFFRWDFNKCPHKSAKLLADALEKLFGEQEDYDKITIVGHSMGGVLVATMVEQWKLKIPADFHVIAAPLGGVNRLVKECGAILPKQIPPSVRLFQWRTQHQLDGAYKELEVDPQVVSLEGSLAITLPETYRERRLGHNWSVSYVADRIASTRKDN